MVIYVEGARGGKRKIQSEKNKMAKEEKEKSWNNRRKTSKIQSEPVLPINNT